jgi:hypothetical protein
MGSRSPNLDEVLDVARPLLLRSEHPEFPLFRAGTCFLVTFRGDLWVVASRHAFEANGAAFYDAVVPASLDDRRLRPLQLVASLEPRSDDTFDTAWLDFVLLRSSDRLAYAEWAIDLDRTELAPFDSASANDWVRVCGFPDGLQNQIAYPDWNVAVSRFNADGRYGGLTESRDVHAVDFESFGLVHSVNNMSGGPAFFARPDARAWWFAGVVVRGTVQSRRLRFVDARAIVRTLTWHYDEDTSAKSLDPSKRGAAWHGR